MYENGGIGDNKEEQPFFYRQTLNNDLRMVNRIKSPYTHFNKKDVDSNVNSTDYNNRREEAAPGLVKLNFSIKT